ncbi:hypothetical protein ACLB2K_003541 [Fragaria x ananassa]
MPLSYCVAERKPCVRWVEKYFKDCLCNLGDDFSFGFGLVSLVCWGVAEIPQIITNFQTKSSHGVSLAFLLTWVAGDVFNLMGCLLEPATLPTQYYTALTIYYDHFYTWWKCGKVSVNQATQDEEEDYRKPLNPEEINSGVPIPTASIKAAPRREFYYTSARSMAGSGTPPFRTYMRVAKSGPSTMAVESDSSSEDESAPVTSKKSVRTSQPRPIPRSVGYGAFLATSLNLPFISKGMTQVLYMGNTGRKLLQGLNPLMFVFALIANVTYVASILVRTIEWDSIKANMSWLLDAAVCVALDLFIILQYMYYRHWRESATSGDEEDKKYYKEQDKAVGA